MQVIAVLGSLTAGEMALSAMSTIWMTPNSTSCCSVRVGPISKAERSSDARAGSSRSSGEREQRDIRGHEMSDPPQHAHPQLERLRELEQATGVDVADVAGDSARDRNLALAAVERHVRRLSRCSAAGPA